MISSEVGTAAQRTARYLVRTGLNVHVIALGLNRPGASFMAEQEDGVKVHRTSPGLSQYSGGSPEELSAIGDYVVKLHDA